MLVSIRRPHDVVRRVPRAGALAGHGVYGLPAGRMAGVSPLRLHGTGTVRGAAGIPATGSSGERMPVVSVSCGGGLGSGRTSAVREIQRRNIRNQRGGPVLYRAAPFRPAESAAVDGGRRGGAGPVRRRISDLLSLGCGALALSAYRAGVLIRLQYGDDLERTARAIDP